MKEDTTPTQHYQIVTSSMEHVKAANETLREQFGEIAEVQIEPILKQLPSTAVTKPHQKEVVSYQRFGRIDKKINTKPFKCHLCGFSCRFKESLLLHFRDIHPN